MSQFFHFAVKRVFTRCCFEMVAQESYRLDSQTSDYLGLGSAAVHDLRYLDGAKQFR